MKKRHFISIVLFLVGFLVYGQAPTDTDTISNGEQMSSVRGKLNEDILKGNDQADTLYYLFSTRLVNISDSLAKAHDSLGIHLTTLQAQQVEIDLNTAKQTNVSTQLSLGTITGTTVGITSEGSANDVILPEANTTQAGLLGAAKWNEIVANNAKGGGDMSYADSAAMLASYAETIEVQDLIHDSLQVFLANGEPGLALGDSSLTGVGSYTTRYRLAQEISDSIQTLLAGGDSDIITTLSNMLQDSSVVVQGDSALTGEGSFATQYDLSSGLAAVEVEITDTALYTDYTVAKTDSNAYTPDGYSTMFALDSIVGLSLKYTTFHAEMDTIWDQCSPKPPIGSAIALNKFVQSMNDSSYWDRCDGIWLLGGGREGWLPFDLIHPESAYTLVNSPTWTNDGYLADSTNERFINTNINLTTETENYGTHDVTLIVYVTNNATSTNPALGAHDGGTNCYINPQYIDGDVYTRLNNVSASTSVTAGNDSRGCFSATRSESTTQYIYVNGNEYSTSEAETSTSTVGEDLIIGGKRDAGTFISDFRIAFSILMDGTTAGENIGIYGMIQTLATDLGFNQ